MVIPIKLNPTKDRSYEIHIGELANMKFNRKVAIVTNPTVSKLHLNRLLPKLKALEIKIIEIPDGEKYKNMDTILFILDSLFKDKFDRGSLLIAFGGGVVGDITGFTASIYQRGIDFIQIPTTLLSQVDASVGGKTGVNSKYGKNLIGSFYQPKRVYIDPFFLITLPEREYRAGLAEVIKIAVMFDKDFFHFLESRNLYTKDAQVEMIARSIYLKADVVNKDEKEAGMRAVLNYGHTFGHVIENETEYKKFLHGEAVAIGMVMANSLAIRLNLLKWEDAMRIKNLLEKYELPTRYTVENVNRFYNKFFLDKKSIDGKLKFILPNGSIGSHIIKKDVDEKIVKDVIMEFAK